MKSYENPILQLTFDNEWSVSVVRVDDGEYHWSVFYTNPEGYYFYSMYETASEVFSEMAKVQKYETEDE